MSKRAPSLKRPLILQPLLFQFATLFISFFIILAIATRMDSGGLYTDESIAVEIAQAIARDDEGELVVHMTPELAELRAETPDLWFAAEDEAGRSVTFGQVPSQYASLEHGVSLHPNIAPKATDFHSGTPCSTVRRIYQRLGCSIRCRKSQHHEYRAFLHGVVVEPFQFVESTLE